MEYIHRELERKFLAMNSAFKAIMVTGARQTGKTTMLRHLTKGQNRNYVTMDKFNDRELARKDPELFFQIHQPPILIDEIQKTPELFETIKILCDNTEECGLFWLSGTWSMRMLKQAGDSLAGRICILRMYSLSQREIAGVLPEEPLDFSFQALESRSRLFPENNAAEIYTHIWRGGMPARLGMDSEQAEEYWNSYVDSYLMRDAVEDNGVTDTTGFHRFIRACAALCGQQVNYSLLAEAAGLSGTTARNWLKILQDMGIIYLLEPYSGNDLKRMIRNPKLYFCDTGLCAHLASWPLRDALMNSAVAGHYFENHVVAEILRNNTYAPAKALMSYYRDREQREIDLILEQNGILHPLEIKMSARPDPRIVQEFAMLPKGGRTLGNGGIICMIGRPYPITEDQSFIPANLI